MTFVGLALASISLAVVGGAGGAPPPPPRPCVLLVTIDTLRPDAVGWIGHRNETETMDRLAAEGARFPAAVSPVPLTLPAHTSIMTGLIPRHHGVADNGQTVREDVALLAELLAARGYATAAFVSGFPLERVFGLDRGFDHYDDDLRHGVEGWVERPAEETTGAATTWLEKAPGPWFVWVHYYDPHDPYDPPRAFWRPGARGAYDGEVGYTDHWLGKLVAAARGASGGSLLTVVTADHGEGLGEHQERTHGLFLYDSTVLVPLVFHFPGTIAPRDGASASPRLVDVAPTILDLLGVEVPPGIDGVSLLPLLSGRPQETPAAYVETRLPWIFYGWSPLAAVRTGAYKLIEAPRPELYDLRADPAETLNLHAALPREAARLAETMRKLEGSAPRVGRAIDDAEALAQLEALGYVGAGGGDREAPAGLPDPKDRIAERDALLAAEDELRAGRFDSAVAHFDEVLVTDPANRFATLRGGIARLKQGRLSEAVERLEKAVALDPDRAESRNALADALARSGHPDRAIPHWQELVRLQPRRAEGWSNLGMALLAAGRPGDARDALRHAVEIAPDRLELRHNLGLAELAMARGALTAKDLDAARAAVAAALAADPTLAGDVAEDAALVGLAPRGR